MGALLRHEATNLVGYALFLDLPPLAANGAVHGGQDAGIGGRNPVYCWKIERLYRVRIMNGSEVAKVLVLSFPPLLN